MRYFIDTEFIERGYEKVELISIAIVADDGREYYAVAEDGWDPEHADPWVQENVLPYVEGAPRRTRMQILQDIVTFVFADPGPHEFWGYYADYDWVLFCQLFGRMIDLPKGLPRFCRDVKQLCVDLGNPPLPKQPDDQHHALADARHIRTMFHFLKSLANNGRPV